MKVMQSIYTFMFFIICLQMVTFSDCINGSEFTSCCNSVFKDDSSTEHQNYTVLHYITYPVTFVIAFILGLLICWRKRHQKKGLKGIGDTDYTVVQLPEPADNDAENQQEPNYSVVMELKTSENEAPDSKDSDLVLTQAPKVAVQKFDDSNEYAVVQKPKADKKKALDNKDSDYSLVQAPKMTEQTPENKDSDYSLVQLPKGTEPR
ncbi:uncharacterized protein LOC121298735 isoform X2 [Polyodon spathula]|uniref:uncharacterized protein LOC121298735 isoform X2 n=1 Tax=Polyodon spathula TaxID=7913 RepID=UPI001B7F1B1B|nr:uncharacterized protein LOC121298735 isoform X2 [Polyodon spathula]